MKANAKNGLISDYFRLQGKKGGKSKSQSKVEAVRANLAKARARRWPRRKAKAVA